MFLLLIYFCRFLGKLGYVFLTMDGVLGVPCGP